MKTFHHFRGGYEISDWEINRWIRNCLKAVEDGATHYSISSGDTSVIALVYDSEIQIHVANQAGRSTLRFSTSKGWEDPIEFEEYVRPVVTPACTA